MLNLSYSPLIGSEPKNPPSFFQKYFLQVLVYFLTRMLIYLPHLKTFYCMKFQKASEKNSICALPVMPDQSDAEVPITIYETRKSYKFRISILFIIYFAMLIKLSELCVSNFTILLFLSLLLSNLITFTSPTNVYPIKCVRPNFLLIFSEIEMRIWLPVIIVSL